MTITSTTAENTYQGAGSAGPFAYTFMVFQYSHLQVTATDPNGVVTPLVYGVDFTATGVLAKNGGTVTLTVALAVGWTLTIQRVVPLVQLTDLRNQGTFLPATYEDALDYITMIGQQLAGDFDISLNAAAVSYTAAGGVQRTVQTKLGETVSVTDFGAKGNGVADDTAAIQASEIHDRLGRLDYLTLPAGTYRSSGLYRRQGLRVLECRRSMSAAFAARAAVLAMRQRARRFSL